MTRPRSAVHAPESSEPLCVSTQLKGARLLILGGTGFLGKVFWSMLLDRYPEIEKVYLLVRATGGRSSEDRFWHSIAPSEALNALRDRYEGGAYREFLSKKIIPIDGDVGEHLCGIDPVLLAKLRGKITAVANVAGVVDLIPPLDEAVRANALGAQNLVDLCKYLGNTPLFHTSTCYVAGGRKGPNYEEDPNDKPFPLWSEADADRWDVYEELEYCTKVIAEAKGAPKGRESLIASGTSRAALWGWPNTYTYTKSIGEQLIARSGLPFAIGRPACCETTQSYPFPGWNEGISTSAPIIFLAMKGQLHVPVLEVPLDFIPTDYVAAGMIMSLAELIEGTAKPVYQYGGSDLNPCTAARIGELIGLYKRKHFIAKRKRSTVSDRLQGLYEPLFVSEERFDRFGPPALAAASRKVARVLKRVRVRGAVGGYVESTVRSLEQMAKREERIAAIMKLFTPFTTRLNGPFDCSNTRAAFARLTEGDRAKLPWYPELLDYAVWMHEIHLPAMERWVIPEMEKKLRRRGPSARQNNQTKGGGGGSKSGDGSSGSSSTELRESRQQLPPLVQKAGKHMLGHLRGTFYERAMRPTIFGEENIPRDRNVIVVSNHASHLDMGLVRHALGDYGNGLVSFAATDYFFRGTLRRVFFENFSNLHPVDRKGGLRRTLRQAGEILERSKTVLIFPEGTRSRTGEINEFKPLIGHLAMTHGVDLLPIYLGGTHESMPKGALFPIHRTLVARIGPPLRVADLHRVTDGMGFTDAVREVARLARLAVVALGREETFNLADYLRDAPAPTADRVSGAPIPKVGVRSSSQASAFGLEEHLP